MPNSDGGNADVRLFLVGDRPVPAVLAGEMVPMKLHLAAEQIIRVGEKVVIEGPSPSKPYSVVFEDDGDTGYFYGQFRGQHTKFDAEF